MRKIRNRRHFWFIIYSYKEFGERELKKLNSKQILKNDLSFLKKYLYPPNNYKVMGKSLFCLTDHPLMLVFWRSQKASRAIISLGSKVPGGNMGLLETRW